VFDLQNNVFDSQFNIMSPIPFAENIIFLVTVSPLKIENI
jgi:hypothetical protein